MVSLRSEVSGISKDLQSLTGRFDENKYFIDKSLKDKSSEMDLLRAQITALETQVKEIQAKLSSKTDTDAAPKDKIEGKKKRNPRLKRQSLQKQKPLQRRMKPPTPLSKTKIQRGAREI